MSHLSMEEITRIADGEADDDGHLRECVACANAVLAEARLKRAIREAMPRYTYPGRAKARPTFPLAIAAMLVLAIVAIAVLYARRPDPMRELVDLHATLLASANPVDVISTDRHTVKPWFEGRVPFAVPVPDLPPPFRLAGGRVVYWRQQPGAYLLITKGAHRISLFIFRDELRATPPRDMTSEVWRGSGLTFVAIADVSQEDLQALRQAFSAASNGHARSTSPATSSAPLVSTGTTAAPGRSRT